MSTIGQIFLHCLFHYFKPTQSSIGAKYKIPFLGHQIENVILLQQQQQAETDSANQ